MIALSLLLTLFLTLATAAFCAGVETGFLSVSRERILHLAREGGRKALKIQRALSDMGRTTTTLLIGNNLANVAYSSAAAALNQRLSGSNATIEAVLAFLAAFTVLYVSEFLPKLLCAARPLRHTLALADVYGVMAVVLSPLTTLALRVTDLFVPRVETRYRVTANDLVRILRDRKDGVCLSDVESALISRLIVLRVKNRPVTAEALLDAVRNDYEPPERAAE